MDRIILSNQQAPGDIVMLTAAVRDLHKCYPGKFITDVQTNHPALWQNNPYLTPLDKKASDVRTIRCHYPLIHSSNTHPYHFIHGFIEYLNSTLKLHIKPTAFKGDIHLSHAEKKMKSQVHEIAGSDIPFWLIVSGGKYDFTAKWWDPRRYQEVVDYFKDEICFVQVGEDKHHHPPLQNVIDLRGKTDLRQLVRLVYHAQGAITPVSLLMHLAAAVETKPGMPKQRPCVVIAGGREPVQWEAYPTHQFIHTIGALPCCETGGCWKSRVKRLGDGSRNDKPENLCVDVVGELPHCMDMITAEEVVHRVELYFNHKKNSVTGGISIFIRQPQEQLLPQAAAPQFLSTLETTPQTSKEIFPVKREALTKETINQKKINNMSLRSLKKSKKSVGKGGKSLLVYGVLTGMELLNPFRGLKLNTSAYNRVRDFYEGNGRRSQVHDHEETTDASDGLPGYARYLDLPKDLKLTRQNARKASELFIQSIPEFPDVFEGRGIIICAGGVRLFTSAWVCIKMLRHHGCELPIQLWYLGESEVDGQMKAVMKPLGVECIDAHEVRKNTPVRILKGWELKAYAILHSNFREVLLLDADNVPVVNPEALFETDAYKKTGAIFWPDLGRLAKTRPIWKISGIPYNDEPEFESGQMVVDKQRSWSPLNLAMWYNAYSDFFYKYVHGDKETFHLAFRKLSIPYSMIPFPVKLKHGTLYQHDFNGNLIFQHRNGPKWNYHNDNPKLPEFKFQDECFDFLKQLKAVWDGTIAKDFTKRPDKIKQIVNTVTSHVYKYNRVGYDERLMSFLPNGKINVGKGDCEQTWDVYENEGAVQLEIGSEKARTCVLQQYEDNVWRGKWLIHEQMPVELSSHGRK